MNNAALRHWFAQPTLLWLMFALPALTVLAFFAKRRQRRTMTRFGRLPALAALTEKRRPRRFLRSLCWTLGISALSAGLAGPRWGREEKPSTAPGRDLVVLLDLSRSMLADDVIPLNPKGPPSRQQQAKEALVQLVRDTLQKRGGNRVALVAFAARAAVICPLTHDYDHFCEKLAELDAAQLPLDLRPTETSKSGTRIGAGLRLAVETHDPRFHGSQDILMISDGDDPRLRDGEWRAGLEAAKEAGIPVYTVGLGNPTEGGKVPTRDGQTLTHQGKEVVTRLQPRPLQEIAKRTHGTYTEAGVNPPRLGELFRGTIERGPKREVLDDALPSYQQRYPWFFGAALFFLAAEMMLGREGKKKSEVRSQKSEVRNRRSPTPLAVSRNEATMSHRTPVAAFALLALSLLGAAPEPDAEELVRQGNAAFEREDFQAAVAAYTKAEERITDPGLVAFNKGAALFRLEHYAEAAAHYRRSLEDATGAARAAMLYNLGNCLLHESRGSNGDRLKQAIAAFGQCLRQPGLADDIRANARHNLELAKLLWLKAKQGRPNPENGNNSSEAEDPPPKLEPKTPDDPTIDPGEVGPNPSGEPSTTGQPTTDPGTNPMPTKGPPPPGTGNLPPVPDNDELTRMLPEDAAAHLQRAAERVRRERRDHRLRMAPAASRLLPEW